MVKRELSDIRYSQSETDRRTQDSLETVHNTLGHVVDRLSMIENDLRAGAHRTGRAGCAGLRQGRAAGRGAPARAAAGACAAAQTRIAESGGAGAFCRCATRIPCRRPAAGSAPPLPPRAISEILEPHAAPPRLAIEPDLPPDHPLEPGTRPGGRGSPTERIAASESAIAEIPNAKKEPVSTSSFIAAARRAAQAAAAAQPVNEKAGRAAAKAAAKAKAAEKPKAAKSMPRSAQDRRQGRRQRAFDHHLENPLAPGRRKRGGDRARHLPDGDDAARHRRRAANAADGEFERAGSGPIAGGKLRRAGTGARAAPQPRR